MYAFEDESEHEHYVNEIHDEHKRVIKLCRSELCWGQVVEDIAEEPISKGKHCDVDCEEK